MCIKSIIRSYRIALESLYQVWPILIGVQSCAKSAVTVPSFIPSLITASIYRVDAPSALKVLLNDGQYVNALIRSVGAAGGSEEENRNVKFQGLEIVKITVCQMHREEYPYQTLQVMLKEIEEQFMEEGADEEFCSCQFLTVDEILIQQDAYQAIKALLNSYQDDMNRNQQ
ncbi:MAG: hypothetical protein EZS28_026996 [Streblomastix strix]|uniref:Uncharacterized protein n=1 Tax=Streblomastix strix TaxID=222440 RepID=A0A5J4V4F0_9EUKA|nr:MAG: hypothetical protein EZS28_026996 [Streblomastix strix]